MIKKIKEYGIRAIPAIGVVVALGIGYLAAVYVKSDPPRVDVAKVVQVTASPTMSELKADIARLTDDVTAARAELADIRGRLIGANAKRKAAVPAKK